MSAKRVMVVIVAGWLVGWGLSVAFGDAPQADQFNERVTEFVQLSQ